MWIPIVAWAVLAAPADAPADDLRPVTIAVVDGETGAPVASFSYKVGFEAVGRTRHPDEAWTAVESASGTFVVPVPVSCRLSVAVKGRDYLGGPDMREEFLIRSTDAARRVVIKLTPGIAVRGTVRDAASRRPIPGVKVWAMTRGLRGTDGEEWAVVTDGEGRYELHGVDPERGVLVAHPDYREVDSKEPLRGVAPQHDVLMNRFEPRTIRGTVREPSGGPLGGVRVAEGLWTPEPEAARTAPDGTFRVRDPGFAVEFRKEGYITRQLGRDAYNREGLVVVLEPTIPLEGQVLAPDGRPVESFTVGAGPGPLPRQYDDVERAVRDRSGRFALGLQRAGPSWVGVRAEGYAAWEGMADVARGGKPLAIRLEPGVTVSARVDAPMRGGSPIRATLVPRRDKSDQGGMWADRPEVFATRTTDVGPDGALRFDHVRPDRYRLRLDGPKITPTTLAIDVPREGADLGAIRLLGRGRVIGRVFRHGDDGGGPWEFAWGALRSDALDRLQEIEFKSDEDGRFAIDDVPAGTVRVCFQYAVFDVIDAHVWSTQVVEGRTTEVHAFEPGAMRPLPIAFAVGDGTEGDFRSGSGLAASRLVDNVTSSTMPDFGEPGKPAPRAEARPPMFFLELTPQARGPLAFAEPSWAELDGRRRVVVPDVAPGAYRLRVLDWLGLTDLTDGVLLERDVTVPPAEPIRIPLGAGCITGKGPAHDDSDRRVVAVAVPRDGRGPSRRGRADRSGNFCVRYLTPGRYDLRVYDPATGWARVDDVAVAAGAVDLGEIRTQPGGTLAGTIALHRPVPVPDEVVATDDAGVALTRRFEVYSSFDRFELRGLWPGRWTVVARSGGVVVATATATLAGTGTVPVDLATERGNGP